MERCRATWRVAILTIAVLVTACSDIETGVPQPGPIDPTVQSTDDGEFFTERAAADTVVDGVTVDGDVTAVDDDGQPVEPVTESLPPVAETGVPGIDSDNVFCRSWSTYAGSVQALALAWATQSPQDAALLEVAATAAISQAIAGMADALPDAIESNRQALTVDVPGPFLRRADRARALLVDAGFGGEQIDALGGAWVEAITEQGAGNETLAIDVPPDSVTGLDGASQRFADELPSLVEDPTLDTTEFDITSSLDYITAECPDQGTLAGNDVIASGEP